VSLARRGHTLGGNGEKEGDHFSEELPATESPEPVERARVVGRLLLLRGRLLFHRELHRR